MKLFFCQLNFMRYNTVISYICVWALQEVKIESPELFRYSYTVGFPSCTECQADRAVTRPAAVSGSAAGACLQPGAPGVPLPAPGPPGSLQHLGRAAQPSAPR